MSQSIEFKKGLAKVACFALLSLFLLPACTLWFVEHAQSSRDAQYLAAIGSNIESNTQMSSLDKAKAHAYFRANPPSLVCNSVGPDAAEYRDGVCSRYSELWQYNVVVSLACWTMLAGAVVLFAILALGALAFANRNAQYVSFVMGWNLLRFFSAAELLVQGMLLVWLSFWVTAFFFERYYIKLIGIAALVAGAAIFLALVAIFKRPPNNTGIDGELVSEVDAPSLWARLRETAKHLGTAPPDRIVAGIDTNFFVTESPLLVREATLSGRSLFVSLPLLRVLDRSEADAVLAHELAHFSGGDTASSARLGPELIRYDHYCHLMRTGGATIVVFHLMSLYRLIFEFALRRDSREREFRADRAAAKLVSPDAIVNALIKVAAYANYRSKVEQNLFEHSARHGTELGIAQQVAAGLAPYATSAQFTDSMKTANVPHPFDSHPPMVERMRNLGLNIAEHDYGAIVTVAPRSSWVSDIQTADVIEQSLWSRYEQQFAAEHELSLAYRYEPSNAAEIEIVLRYFPAVSFSLDKEKAVEISYSGLRLPDITDMMPWDRVSNFKYTDRYASDVLDIVHPEKGLLGAKKTKVKLTGIKPQRDAFKQTLGRYWQRHQAMRRHQATQQRPA